MRGIRSLSRLTDPGASLKYAGSAGQDGVYIAGAIEADACIAEVDLDAGTYYSGTAENIYQGTLTLNAATGIYEATRTATGTVSTGDFHLGLAFNEDKSKLIGLGGGSNTALGRSLTVPGDVSGGITGTASLSLSAIAVYKFQVLDGGTTLIAVFSDSYRRWTLSTPWDLSTASVTATISHGLTLSSDVEELMGFEDGGLQVWVREAQYSEAFAPLFLRELSTPYDITTGGVYHPAGYVYVPTSSIMGNTVSPGGAVVRYNRTGYTTGIVYRHNL